MKRIIGLILIFLCIVGAGVRICSARQGEPRDAPDTLVICPPKFQSALQTWTDYRTEQGHQIEVIAPAATALEIKRQILEVAQTGSLKWIFIVGDVNDRRSDPEVLVTTDYVAAKVNVKFGSEPEIATDSTYSDLDNDGIPDLSIGRLPVDSIDELEQYTRRMIRYESENENAVWKRRINFIAGVGGFGQVIDGLIEQTTKQIITDLVPGGYETTMTYGSWSSPYCPDPRQFSKTTIDRFNEGCLFWVYLGHGSRHRLDQMRTPDRRYLILDNASVPQLDCRHGSPIALFLACYTGAMDDPDDCLAETMLRQSNGPIATICGTRVTMPYAMSLLSLELVHEYFEGDARTLGELLMVAKQRLVRGSNNNPEYRNMIEGAGATFSPTPTLLKAERLEHVKLIHLMGDPLLRLKRPSRVTVDVADKSISGSRLIIKGDVPSGGELTLELAYQRDRLRQRAPRRNQYDSSDESLLGFQKTYDEARELVCCSTTLSVTKGPFATELIIPDDAVGRCVVRAVLVSDQGLGIGSDRVVIKRR